MFRKMQSVWMVLGFICLFPLGCNAPVSTPKDIELPSAECEPLIQAIEAAAQAEAVCQTDADCGVRDVPLCSVRGIGCYYHITNTSHPTKALDVAINRYQKGLCPLAKCDCSSPPAQFMCENNRCAKKVCWEDHIPECDPDSTCPASVRRKVPCP